MLCGYSDDGREMKITVRQTIFGNTKYVLWGLGENLLGWSGWAKLGKFETLEEAIKYAEFRYGFTKGGSR